MPAAPYKDVPNSLSRGGEGWGEGVLWGLAKASHPVLKLLFRRRGDMGGRNICGTCLALAGQRARQRPPDVSQLSQNGWVLSHNGDALGGFSEAAVLSASSPEEHRRTRMPTQAPTRPQAIPGWLNAALI